MQLSAVPWRCVVIDEAHRLKNRNCKLLEGLKNLNMVSQLFVVMRVLGCALFTHYNLKHFLKSCGLNVSCC